MNDDALKKFFIQFLIRKIYHAFNNDALKTLKTTSVLEASFHQFVLIVEMVIIVVGLVALATLLLVFGIILNSLILHHLRKKSQLQKTSLDLVFIETLAAVIFVLLNVYNGLVLGLTLHDISYPVLIVLTAISELANNLFGVSVITMMLTKITFLLYPSKMLEKSDRKVREWAMICRFILFIITVFLNNAKSVKNDPSFFQLIEPSSQYQCPGFLKVGVGNGFIMVIMFAVTICAEALAFKANGGQKAETFKIAGFLFISIIILALVNYVLALVGTAEFYTDAVVYALSFYTLFLLGIIFPLLIIFRTPNLKMALFSSKPSMISVNV